MTHFFINLAKLVMLVIWGILISNLHTPFPGKIAVLLYLLLGFLIFTHIIQLLAIYHVCAKKIKLTKYEAVQIFTFGIFKLWQIKKRII